MGFFSWDCEECGESLKAPYDCRPEWHNDGVAICDGGTIIHGEYDGYGNLGGFKITYRRPTVYHLACWKKAGKPHKYKGESDHAADQGYFYGGDDEDEV